MKSTLLKIALVTICLPSVSLATVPKGGAARGNTVANSAKAELSTRLAEANINLADADGIKKAIDKKLINDSQVDNLIKASSDSKFKELAENTLAMVAASAAYNMTDFTGMNLPHIDSARNRFVELAIEATNGGSHSVDSLNQFMAAATEGYKASKSPEDLAGTLNGVLDKTSTAEAKAEAEKTGKSLLELAGKCKS